MTPFYHQTIKQVITTFGAIFDSFKITTDHDEIITVPIHYSPREKFITFYQASADLDEIAIETTLPRMGFELTGLNFSPERHTNSLNRMKSHVSDEKKFMWNRVPYDFNFSLYIMTKKFEDSLKIVEQILPNFTPDLNVSIKDMNPFEIVTDIPFTLTSSSFAIDYEGLMDAKRSINWEISFSAKAYLYGSIREQERIKTLLVNVGDTEREISYGKEMFSLLDVTP